MTPWLHCVIICQHRCGRDRGTIPEGHRPLIRGLNLSDSATTSAFVAKLRAVSRAHQSLLCVGLDVDLAALPEHIARERDPVYVFNRAIIDATVDLVCAYKPNLAFYEALGPAGLDALYRTVQYIPKHIPVIADAKRGDIGSSAQAYAKALFDVGGFDACTASPFLGQDAVAPFLAYRDRGVFFLCRTSNPGGADFQELRVIDGDSGRSRPLYEVIAARVQAWNGHGNCGLVVGATFPAELRSVRALAPDLPLLIPGVGAQGGDLAAAVRYGVDTAGELAIINSSRQVLYASRARDFASAARAVAQRLVAEIGEARAMPHGS